jgi:hypothetical protein
MTVAIQRPGPDEFAPFYADYIAEVPPGAHPVDLLATQLAELPRLLGTVQESGAAYRYAPGKWSIKEVVGHVSDAERVFAYRLLRIGRGDETPLPGFDENQYVPAGAFDARTLTDLVGEWVAIREATLALVRGLPAEAWARRGVANGRPISARALAYIIPGHVQHHLGVLRTRYGIGTTS